MSSIDFSNLKTSEPTYAKSWDLIETWFTTHGSYKEFTPSELVQYFKSNREVTWDEVIELSKALEVLVAKGKLRRLFALESSSGQLLFPYYPTRSSIPRKVRGQFDEYVNTSELEIRSVFTGVDENE